MGQFVKWLCQFSFSQQHILTQKGLELPPPLLSLSRRLSFPRIKQALIGLPARQKLISAPLMCEDTFVNLHCFLHFHIHQIFTGNSDRNTPVPSMLAYRVVASLIRIRPVAWHHNISLRFELLGCGEGKMMLMQILKGEFDKCWITASPIMIKYLVTEL